MAFDGSRDIGAALGRHVRYHLTRQDAWHKLRAYNQCHNQKIYDLVLEVLELGTCRPGPTAP